MRYPGWLETAATGWLAPLGLGAPLLVVAALAWGFAPGRTPGAGLVGLVTALLTFSGAVWALAAPAWSRWRPGPRALAGCLLVGLGLRLVMLGGPPILEDDHYRYLWDGAVSAHGHNPYAHSPRAVREGAAEVPPELRELVRQAGPILERINYPWLRGIYPPLCQAAWALAHWLAPWSLDAWRLVLLAVDLAGLGLLAWLLATHGLPAGALLIPWLNPLLIQQTYNAGHLDLLLFPWLWTALGLVAAGWRVVACLALGLAAGVKFWPLLLLPVALAGERRPWRLVAGVALGVLPAVALAAPVWFSGPAATSGLGAFAGRWEMNDAAFLALRVVVAWLPGPWPHEAAARLLVAALVGLAGLGVWWRGPADGLAGAARSGLWLTALLFMLSPAQFPWYYLWLLPFLALAPWRPLLWLTALLPLYFLRVPLVAWGRAAWFDQGLVWLEYAPVWGWLAWAAWRRVARP